MAAEPGNYCCPPAFIQLTCTDTCSKWRGVRTVLAVDGPHYSTKRSPNHKNSFVEVDANACSCKCLLVPSLFFLCTSLTWSWRECLFNKRLPHSEQAWSCFPALFSMTGREWLAVSFTSAARFLRALFTGGFNFYSWFAKCARNSVILLNNCVHR